MMTQGKKAIAVILVAVFIFSALSAVFCASATEQTCTITVELYGDGSVTDGSVTASSVFTATYPVGQTVRLSAVPAAGKEAVFWVLASTDRVVSFTDSYSFTAGSDQYFYIVFEDTQAIASQNGVHQVVYLSEGNNIMYSETLPLGNTDYYEDNVADVNLYSNNKTWLGWDKTPEEVAQTDARVFVHPVYDSNVQSYVVTVIIDDVASYKQGSFNQSIAISAPETLTGEPFSYWLAVHDESHSNYSDTIASYNRVHALNPGRSVL